ncbi:hypothetical protein Tco_0043783, partial [Tanacetum coccineum]
TPLGIKSFARMEQVLVSALVQERLDIEVDKAQKGVDVKLNELNKPKKRKKPRSKWITKNKLLLDNREDIASADQEMIVLAPTVTGDTVLIQDAMGEKVCKSSGFKVLYKT